MTDRVRTRDDLRVLVCPPDGPVLRNDRDAADVLGEAFGEDAALVVLPVQRLDPGFFTLATGIAGAIVQKFAQYGLRLVIRGDVSEYLAGSSTFSAFVREADRGHQLWFVADDAEFRARLASRGLNAIELVTPRQQN